MTAYSTRTRLALQVTGSNTDTWGAVLNSAVFQLVDDAIAGMAEITVTSSDVTLTTADGAEDQARKAIIKATGTLTNNRAVIVPAVTKVYLVSNQTSGAFNLTVKTSAGTGVVVPQGSMMLLFCDGTNVVGGLRAETVNALRPWQVKAGAYTAQAGDRILADSTGGVLTITLPTSPSPGDTVIVTDAGGAAATNNITVARGGENIRGAAEDLTINTNNFTAELVYYNSSRGWVAVLW